jgi:hypothetical protein
MKHHPTGFVFRALSQTQTLSDTPECATEKTAARCTLLLKNVVALCFLIPAFNDLVHQERSSFRAVF